MRENKKASTVSFIGCQVTFYKVWFVVFYTIKPIINYQTIQLVTLLNEDKLVRITKIQKVKVATNFRKFYENLQGRPQKFATLANFAELLLHLSSYGSCSAFAFCCSEALNCY